MSVESLKEKMREFNAGRIGTVSLSDADLAAEAHGHGEATKGTVKAPIPEEARNDAFMNAGEDLASAQRAIVPPPSFVDEIDISEDDRSSFLQAIIDGSRYRRPFSLFGGRLTGTFRCRSNAESDGIIAWMAHLVNVKKLDAHVEYLTSLRNATLAAQVESLRGMVNEDFPELTGPLAPTRSEDGKNVNPPGWVGLADSWESRPPALVAAIHDELQKFEKRYWTMVKNAADQNFWNPAASI